MFEGSLIPAEPPRDSAHPGPEANVLRPDFSREPVSEEVGTRQPQDGAGEAEDRENAAESLRKRMQWLDWQLETLITPPADIEKAMEQELRALKTASKFSFDARAIEGALHAAKKKKEISELQQALDLLKNSSRQDELRKAA